jgi:hypothetical protein
LGLLNIQPLGLAITDSYDVQGFMPLGSLNIPAQGLILCRPDSSLLMIGLKPQFDSISFHQHLTICITTITIMAVHIIEWRLFYGTTHDSAIIWW